MSRVVTHITMMFNRTKPARIELDGLRKRQMTLNGMVKAYKADKADKTDDEEITPVIAVGDIGTSDDEEKENDDGEEEEEEEEKKNGEDEEEEEDKGDKDYDEEVEEEEDEDEEEDLSSRLDDVAIGMHEIRKQLTRIIHSVHVMAIVCSSACLLSTCTLLSVAMMWSK